MELESFISQLSAWARKQPDIHGVLLVGSHARREARADSDIDLVILTNTPGKYLDTISFAEDFGAIERTVNEDWGKVTAVRTWYGDGMEVEFGITTPEWAALPLDPGTQRVISDGVRIIFDRDGELAPLRHIKIGE